MTIASARASPSADNDSGDSNNGCKPGHSWKPNCWTKSVPKCSENLVEDEVELQKLELDSLLPEVKGRILEHLDHENIIKLKSLSKTCKALIESVEFIQALSLKAKPVLTACSFLIDMGVWQWAAFDPNWKSTESSNGETDGIRGKWRRLPPLTFLPPNYDPDPDLFKQFLFCAHDGLVCMNFSKSPHEERLIVFNPLNREWKELPPLLHRCSTQMLQELPPEVSIFLHSFTSMVQKSEGSRSDLPQTEDKVDLDNFPPEVKGHVLDHLSYEQILQLKSLSKGWNSLIQSDGFLQALSLRESPSLTACYFFIENGVWQWAGFDPNWNSTTSGIRGKWRKLPPLTFLPPNCDRDPDLFKRFLFCAHGGLVCMNFFKAPHEEQLIVFNPLTRDWKELPPLILLHRRNPVLMHMFVDPSSKSYHILVAGSSGSGDESLSRITELYDSRTGQWERKGDFPGPAFALNEYQSGVFHNGNIFCIGFLELGDKTVKGILGYNVEGLWSKKWTAEALPLNSTILQLVENNGELFLFSERDNGPVTEHWVDRIEWTQSEGENEEKTDIFQLVNVLRKSKSGGRSLEVYPEFALVPFSESQLCLYNTVDHTGEVFDIEDQEKTEALPSLPEGFQGELGLFSLNPISFAMEPRFSSKV